jgi:protein-disulfide isomerase
MITSAVLTIILVVMLVKASITGSVIGAITKESAGTKVTNIINGYFVQSGEAPLDSVSEESGLYKITLNYNNDKVPVYLTKNGNFLILPNGLINIAELEATAKENTQATPTNVPKTDKPTVELFVMSYCPYGTQIEKGILPVVNLLKDKIDFKVRFVYYAMHGKTEIDEELRQYCIQKEQGDKFMSYLSYFLEKGDAEYALTKANIDKTKLDACIKKADADFKVTEKYNDKSTWLNGKYPLFDVEKELNTKYKVGGSPTLIINGVNVASGRDSASLLQAICSAFSTSPTECNSKLSSEAPSTGFGYSVGNSGSADSGCGA